MGWHGHQPTHQGRRHLQEPYRPIAGLPRRRRAVVPRLQRCRQQCHRIGLRIAVHRADQPIPQGVRRCVPAVPLRAARPLARLPVHADCAPSPAFHPRQSKPQQHQECCHDRFHRHGQGHVRNHPPVGQGDSRQAYGRPVAGHAQEDHGSFRPGRHLRRARRKRQHHHLLQERHRARPSGHETRLQPERERHQGGFAYG